MQSFEIMMLFVILEGKGLKNKLYDKYPYQKEVGSNDKESINTFGISVVDHIQSCVFQ